MLKSLLGHWKAHRRKPSLLPEDGIILHPDDPSRVNPIFEDSDGSVVSSHREPDSLDGGAEQKPTPELTTGIDLDLVDISIPANLEADVSKSADEENPDDVINQIDIAIYDSLTNEEKSRSLEKEEHDTGTTSKEEPGIGTTSKEGYDIGTTSKEEYDTGTTSKEELIDVTSNEVKETQAYSSNTDSERTTIQENTAELRTTETNSQIFYKTETKPVEIVESIDKKDHKSAVAPNMAPKTEDSAIPSTSKETKTEGNKQSKEMNFPTPNLVAEQQSVANIKTRAIDELIKKFQGQNSGNDPIKQTIPSFLHSPNRKPVLKSTTFQPKDVPEKTTSVNGQEKESLSKIFNFPPPPPIDPLQNNKQLEKDKQEIKPSFSKSSASTSKYVSHVEGKTRSDSSLSRNKTVSSNDSKLTDITDVNQKIAVNSDSNVQKEISSETQKVVRSEQSNIQTVLKPVVKTEFNLHKETDSTPNIILHSKADSSQPKYETVIIESPEKNDQQITTSTSSPPLVPKLPSTTVSTSSKQEPESQSSILRKSSLTNSSRSPKSEIKVTHSKPVPVALLPTKEADVLKSNSEDSGITRGDQASSDHNQDIPLPDQPQKDVDDGDIIPPTPAKRNLNDRRSLKSRNRNCKHCRKSHDGGTTLNKDRCDDYYDVLTGARRSSRAKHSGSFSSDLSFEEKELIRRLRSRRDTLRSNATSTRSKHSKSNNGYFQRHNPIRRSMSEDSILNEPSMCSCDQCYMILVKDFAYGRASLRGIPPKKVFCTCRTAHDDFLGRRVKFSSDPILEGSTSDHTSTTPTIPEEPGKEDASKESSVSPQENGGLKKGDKKKKKKTKEAKYNYQIVHPRELEELSQAYRRHLLMKRRRRARYMALMALAMVIFVGLVVTLLMVYLRRKVL